MTWKLLLTPVEVSEHLVVLPSGVLSETTGSDSSQYNEHFHYPIKRHKHVSSQSFSIIIFGNNTSMIV